ncbi:hypothetical protein [Candidatus Nitrotoga sp. HW29]|uniref:hypothetical protein n=1 Tax=Candidatus Nitrotoga sp. HW29 TaxID=2886963 RepID=UPI001EF3D168|nr:hypothetical protein [Candidatus Nitrotoga sp. HW29]
MTAIDRLKRDIFNSDIEEYRYDKNKIERDFKEAGQSWTVAACGQRMRQFLRICVIS